MLGFIIFGTRPITSVAGKGQFRCPRCGPTGYKHKRVKRWFTLYFIPCIPMGQLGEYLECDTCQGTFQVEILQANVDEGQEYREALLRSMAQMAAADGTPGSVEKTRALDNYRALTGNSALPGQLEQEIERAVREGTDLVGYLRRVLRITSVQEREALVRAAVEVGLSDGPLNEAEQAYLNRAGEALELSPAHLLGIVTEASR